MAYGGKDRYNIKTDESMNYADTVDEVLAELVFDGAWRINYDKIEVDEGLDNEKLKEIALSSEKVKELTNGKTIIKTIVVPKKLVNIVVK